MNFRTTCDYAYASWLAPYRIRAAKSDDEAKEIRRDLERKAELYFAELRSHNLAKEHRNDY